MLNFELSLMLAVERVVSPVLRNGNRADAAAGRVSSHSHSSAAAFLGPGASRSVILGPGALWNRFVKKRGFLGLAQSECIGPWEEAQEPAFQSVGSPFLGSLASS